MNLETFPILSVTLLLPTVGALVCLALERNRTDLIRRVALGVSLVTFFLSLSLFFSFRPGTAEFQFVERIPWIPALGIHYFLGIDGISLLLALLTTFMTPLAILASFRDIEDRVKEYMVFMLLLETGMLGVFLALDLFLFYVFWEWMLIPMYFIIGMWGGPRRIYATFKFVLYTMFGSFLMLVAILALYFYHQDVTGILTFDLLELSRLSIPIWPQLWFFLAFFLAFAIKVPLFPLHTWLPDAHVEAPTAGSVILAGILLKTGTYGFLRFSLPLFPDVSRDLVGPIALLAVVGIVYGALVALVQKDLKKLVAYSSVSHLGFVVLGIFALNVQGVEGGILQMINHGLTTGALFLLVGMLYERRHTRMIADYGGLARILPVYATFFLLVVLASAGLPGLNGFVGEFLALVGAFHSLRPFAVVGAVGVVLAAAYLLWMYRRVFFGEVEKEVNLSLPDLSRREVAVLVPIAALIVVIGVYPKPFLERTEASVIHLLTTLEARAGPRAETAAAIGEGRGGARHAEVPGTEDALALQGLGIRVPGTSSVGKRCQARLGDGLQPDRHLRAWHQPSMPGTTASTHHSQSQVAGP